MNDLYPVPLDAAEIKAVRRAVAVAIAWSEAWLERPGLSFADKQCALTELSKLRLLDDKLADAIPETCRSCNHRHAPSGQCSSCAEGGS